MKNKEIMKDIKSQHNGYDFKTSFDEAIDNKKDGILFAEINNKSPMTQTVKQRIELCWIFLDGSPQFDLKVNGSFVWGYGKPEKALKKFLKIRKRILK